MELTIKESGVKTISEILLCDTAYNPAGRINIGTRAYTGICQGGVKYVELFHRGLGLLLFPLLCTLVIQMTSFK